MGVDVCTSGGERKWNCSVCRERERLGTCQRVGDETTLLEVGRGPVVFGVMCDHVE